MCPHVETLHQKTESLEGVIHKVSLGYSFTETLRFLIQLRVLNYKMTQRAPIMCRVRNKRNVTS